MNYLVIDRKPWTSTFTMFILLFFGLSSCAVAATYSDSAVQTTAGQNFMFPFSGVEASDGSGGTLVVQAKGDYTIGSSGEYLDWSIDGIASGVAGPSHGAIILNVFKSDDVEWQQSFSISSADMVAIASDGFISITLDLSSAVNYDIEPTDYVSVELSYGSGCLPPPVPSNPDPCDGAVEVPIDTNLSWGPPCDPNCGVENGGFENGGFSPWTAVTGPGEQLLPWGVSTFGSGYFGNGTPYEGLYYATNGFDGEAGLYYELYQEVEIPECSTTAILSWAERIQWDLVPWGATLPRPYVVSIQPSGGGTPILELYTMELMPGTQGDTGYVHHQIDLLSAAPSISGQTVRISFYEYIPEYYTGPAQFDLDGISLVCNGTMMLNVPSTVVMADITSSQAVVDFNSFANEYERIRSQSETTNDETDSDEVSSTAPEVFVNTEVKEITDTNAPQETIASSGGPDCGGYTFIDSDEPGGPAFDWIEISGTGANLGLSDDSYAWPINIPFMFDFYGTFYNQIAVGSNGTVHFENSYMTLGNQCLPTSITPNRFIAVYWDDLMPNQGGSDNVYYKVVGTAPNRILVVQWHNVQHCCFSDDRVTAQAQLFEGSGNILLLYLDPSSEAGSGGTVGIQRDTTCALQYLCNQRALHSQLAILFSRAPVPPPPDPCPVTYDVYMGPNATSMSLIFSDINEPNCCPGPLAECETYCWQVVAENPNGVTPGPVWSFTTAGVCNQDPNCSEAIPSVPELWPPNHKWFGVNILNVNDPDGDEVNITITGITQDEPVGGRGSGQTAPDGTGVGTETAYLRAERTGTGNGRVYEINFEADDGKDGACQGSVTVCVPHDRSNTGRECVDDGQLYDSMGTELFRADLNGDGIINQLDMAILAEFWLLEFELD